MTSCREWHVMGHNKESLDRSRQLRWGRDWVGGLFERGLVIRFVRDAVRRKGVLDWPAPIMTLQGPRGSGGTVLLDALWDEFRDECPSIHLDLAAAEAIVDVAIAAMQGLRRRVSGIRPLRFPRSRLALKALSYVDDGGGRAAFDADMPSAWSGAARASLQNWADRAGLLLRAPDQQLLAAVVAQVMGVVLAGVDTRREAPYLRWFATNGISSGGTRYDPLWELHRWQHDRSRVAARKVDKTLCAALLADLRADYNNRSVWHGQRTANCLLLLDNAGGLLGTRFLELLAECRRDSGRAEQTGDPLMVVAALRGQPRLPLGTPIDATDPRLRFVTPTTTDDGGHPDWWCPVRLTDLSDDAVIDLTHGGALGSARRDADFVSELTGGHPEAAARVAVLLAALASPTFDARQLMDARVPARLAEGWRLDKDDMTVEDFLLRRALGDELVDESDDDDGTGAGASRSSAKHSALDAMATCAATPGLRRAASSAVFQFMGWTELSAVDVRGGLAAAMWLDEREGAEPRLHPYIKVLLCRWLAHDAVMWRDVHQGYAAHYAQPAHAAFRHHHLLALVEPAHAEPLGRVLGYLEHELGARSTAEWLRLFDIVTAAPNRVRTTRDPRAFVTTLAGTAEPGNRATVIARLTVARWLFGDRLFDPRRRLAGLIADEFDHLAQLSEDGAETLFEQSARHRMIEREWED
jgi:hypothetical protein